MAKSDTHPTYYPSCKVYHNGQVVMTVGATVPEMHVEVWSGSHPFFTGKQTFIDSAGRVEKFTKKYAGNYFTKPEAGKKADAKPEAKPAVLGTDKVQAPKA
jgi:large subunit ribosomal protein L31